MTTTFITTALLALLTLDADLVPDAEAELAQAVAELEAFDAGTGYSHSFEAKGTKPELLEQKAAAAEELAKARAFAAKTPRERLDAVESELGGIRDHHMADAARRESVLPSQTTLARRIQYLHSERDYLSDAINRRVPPGPCPRVARAERQLADIDAALASPGEAVARARAKVERAREIDALVAPLRAETRALVQRAKDAAAALTVARDELQAAETTYGREPSDTAWKRVEAARKAVDRATVIERVLSADSASAVEQFAARAAELVTAATGTVAA